VCTHFCRALLLPIFVCVCERERVKEVDSVCVRIFVEPCCYLYLCVREREKERKRETVCEREREREKERDSV